MISAESCSWEVAEFDFESRMSGFRVVTGNQNARQTLEG